MSKRTNRQVSCCVHDITIFDEISVEELRTIFTDLCKKYTFQKEMGAETGKVHYQCRVSLKQKCRQMELIKKLRLAQLQRFHTSVTTNCNKGNDFYVVKSDTRLEGPFTDENFKYIPRDIRNIVNLYPWQAAMITRLSVYEERIVDVVIDVKGNNGKSRLARWMEIYCNAETIDFANDYKDVMRMAYDMGPKPVYIIDMPRAISKDKLFQFYGAIETLKSGKCFDDRYTYKKRLFDPPRILVFCNQKPDTSLLTGDMWKLWSIDKNKHLNEWFDPEPRIDFLSEEEESYESDNSDQNVWNHPGESCWSHKHFNS